ncbi:uncharacterized protein BDZ99DRAFT_544903 [Mytilinidion resinicola]|uniref:CHAT domain-containing protein n=1 Tax=Mytilinidion resinicola TaxID=574789 RepID=A0A6A6Y8V3_9PEZI|nr:uncharacterized protein BDZ99DRAFT_544903 [Mytilinidion resinicola]KAF2804384.1 hypothetical protein BDZ99DRAFT_544903 [Mytilinidion resinicola]
MPPPPTVEQDPLTNPGREDPDSGDELDDFDNASDIIAIIEQEDPEPREPSSEDDGRRAAILHRAGNELLWLCRHESDERERDLAEAEQETDNSVVSDTTASSTAPDPISSVEVLSRHFSCLALPERLDKATQLLKRAAEGTAPEDRWDKMRRLRDFGLALGDKYYTTFSINDIDAAVEAHRQVLDLLHQSYQANQAIYLNNHGYALFWKFRRISHLRDHLDAGMKAFEDAVVVDATTTNPERLSLLSDLADAVGERFQMTTSEEDLEKLAATVREITGMAAAENATKAVYLNRLGNAYRMLFDVTKSIGHLDNSIQAYDSTLLLSPEDDVGREIPLSSLGMAHFARYEGLGLPEDLDKAIGALQPAAALAAASDQQLYGEILNILGIALRVHFELTGNLHVSSLHKAIETNRRLLDHLGHAKGREQDEGKTQERAATLSNLGACLQTQFDGNGLPGTLEEAIAVQRQAIDLSPTTDSSRSVRLAGLAESYRRRYDLLGKIEDVTAAIQLGKEAIAVTGLDMLFPNEFPLMLTNLGLALVRRYEVLGVVEDLEESMEYCKSAEEASRDKPTVHPLCRNNRSYCMIAKFYHSGAVVDVNEAAIVSKKAMDLASHDQRLLPATHLRDLAEVLATRFEWMGKQSDLDKSIESASRSMEQIPETHPQYALHLTTRGRALIQRAVHTSSARDFNSAIDLLQQAGQRLTEKHPKRSACLNNLATALGLRSLLIGTTDDLNAAVQAAMTATKAFPGDFPGKAVCLTNLGQILTQRFSRAGLDDDIDIAVECQSKALKLTAKSHWRYITILENLSSALLMRFQKRHHAEDAKSRTEDSRGGPMEDLKEAVKHSRQTLELSPETSPERARYLANASRALLALAKSDHSSSVEDPSAANGNLDEAITYSKEAARLSVGDESQSRPEILLSYASSSRMLSQAVELLPRVISRSLLRSDQQFILSQIPGLAADAAALEMRVNKRADEAVRLLELGRGVIAGLYINERSETADVEEAHPELAKRFRDVQERLDRSEEDVLLPDVRSFLQSQAARRYDAVQEFDRIAAEIREQPGFDRFLLGPAPDELTALAVEGPIVYFNVSRYGSTALVITEEKIHDLPLERLRYDDVVAKAEKLSDIRDNDSLVTRRVNNVALGKILQWLWDNAIEEILHFLNFTKVPEFEEKWPRIWWIPVGLLSLFPIHAAGRQKLGLAALDRVISSYATTARSLALSRERILALDKQKSNGGEAPQPLEACLVSMKTTPQRTDLIHAEAEIQAIAELLPIPKTVLAQPTKEQVLESLRRCSIVHFACHGEMHANPSLSRILFSDWEDHRFSVHDMAGTNLVRQARLAYLSACHAGTSRDMFLLDEAMHMTGACQLAGFPAVVGTLWKVLDEYAPAVARDVYARILDQGGSLDVRRTAQALHFAVRGVRSLSERGPRAKPNPIAWAPYIYVGV